MLNLSIEQANVLANQAIKEYRNKLPEKVKLLEPKEVYRVVLTYFLKDDFVDAVEQKTLNHFRELLQIQPEDIEKVDEQVEQNSESEQNPQVLALPKVKNVPSQKSNLIPTKDKAKPVSDLSKSFKANPKKTLKPLLCHKCQGIIPLQRSSTVKCAYCNTLVSIPTEYLEAIAVKKTFQRRKQDVQKFAKELGTAPSAFGQFIAKIPESVLTFFIIVLFVFGPSTMGSHNKFCSVVNSYFKHFRGENLMDVITMPQQVLLTFLPFAILLSLLFSMIYKVRRQVLTMEMIRASLTALPPLKPGSPHVCRQCGAPLVASDNAVAVTCIYCSTDNLLHIPAEWMASSHKQARLIGMSFTKGQKVYLKEKLKGWETLIALILGSLALAVLHVQIIKRCYEWSDHRPLNETLKARSGLRNDSAKAQLLRFDKWTKLSKSIFPAKSFIVPLQKNERLSIKWRPSKKQIGKIKKVEFAVFLEQNFFDSGKKRRLEKYSLSSSETLKFTSQLGAYYRITISLPDKNEIDIFAEVSKGSK